jgi:hypothetical protein
MANPYQDKDDHCFWSRAMTWPAPGQINPVISGTTIGADARIATMGSCFAQHLARFVKASGLNYYVAEAAPAGMSEAAANASNYGIFSARFGNVYTVRQAVQLFDRAFGAFAPADDVWAKGGRFVDAFRPTIEPEAFSSPDDVRRAARGHLACVREMFERFDWLVFTLGLTEGWRAKADGAVYPVAPGVAGGSFDPSRYEFVNFSAAEVSSDLAALVDRIRKVNPRGRILLTVSPVPLIATYENRHVWVSTTYSKAALRVAADETERRYQHVIYFPSYEVITSPASGGRYYADDLRSVTDLGVKHVMRLFHRHFIEGATHRTDVSASLPTANFGGDVICDEEVIETALRASGFASSGER